MLLKISIGLVIMGFVLLLTGLVLMFVWKVPTLIDELSGRKAKRQIERMKNVNLSTSGINAVSTGELYESLKAVGDKDVYKSNTLGVSSLSKMVNNPYGVSNSANIGSSDQSISNAITDIDNDKTDIVSTFEDSKTDIVIGDSDNSKTDIVDNDLDFVFNNSKSINKSVKSIKIICEQTSLKDI